MHFEASVICALCQPRQPPPSPSPPTSAWRPPPTRTCGTLNCRMRFAVTRFWGCSDYWEWSSNCSWRCWYIGAISYLFFGLGDVQKVASSNVMQWVELSRVELNWLHSLFMYNLQIVFPTNRTTNLTNKVQFLDPSIHSSIMIAVEGFLDDPEEARDDRGQTMRFLSVSNEYFSPFSSVYRRLHVWLLTLGEIL